MKIRYRYVKKDTREPVCAWSRQFRSIKACHKEINDSRARIIQYMPKDIVVEFKQEGV